MTFQLDTTGTVVLTPLEMGHPVPIPTKWDDLTPFTQGYIEALFAEADLTLGEAATHDFGKVVGFSDLAPETLERIIADCGRYLDQTSIQPHQATQEDGRAFYALRQSAPDYFNGPAMAQTMEGEPVASVYYFPPQTVQLGDDGQVRFARATGAAA